LATLSLQHPASPSSRDGERGLRSRFFTLSARIVLLLILWAAPAAARQLAPLTAPPLGERWFSIAMNGERVGFAHLSIASTEGSYVVTSESSAKLLVMGFSREATVREQYRLDGNLALKSFSVEQIIDKSPLKVSGTVKGKTVKVLVETKGGTSEKTLKIKGAIYPPPVVNLYPLFQGVKAGRTYKLQMLDTEGVKVKDVKFNVVGFETLNGTDTIHLRNDLYPVVDNDIWVDRAGNTLRESVRDGLILTQAESATEARRFLLEDAVSKKELVLDFSLVRVDREIENQSELKGMIIELSDLPEGMSLPEGPGQSAIVTAPGKVRMVMSAQPNPPGAPTLALADRERYLSATPRINADNQEIIACQQKVLQGCTDQRQAATLLTRWVAEHLADTVKDSHSAVEALQNKTGNCQSHARLYVSLARAAGIPSRMVAGLVYAAGKGFLYHSWAESYLDGWTAIDPTFGQIPADVTHIKLAEGDEPDEMAALAGIIGRVKATVIETR